MGERETGFLFSSNQERTRSPRYDGVPRVRDRSNFFLHASIYTNTLSLPRTLVRASSRSSQSGTSRSRVLALPTRFVTLDAFLNLCTSVAFRVAVYPGGELVRARTYLFRVSVASSRYHEQRACECFSLSCGGSREKSRDPRERFPRSSPFVLLFLLLLLLLLLLLVFVLVLLLLGSPRFAFRCPMPDFN